MTSEEINQVIELPYIQSKTEVEELFTVLQEITVLVLLLLYAIYSYIIYMLIR